MSQDEEIQEYFLLHGTHKIISPILHFNENSQHLKVDEVFQMVLHDLMLLIY